jgi:hypothetical protein
MNALADKRHGAVLAHAYALAQSQQCITSDLRLLAVEGLADDRNLVPEENSSDPVRMNASRTINVLTNSSMTSSQST